MEKTIILSRPILTWAEQHTGALREARAQAQATTGLSPEDYTEHVFHHGCLFAQMFADTYLRRPSLADELTINPAYGFWAWWRMKWLMDDAGIMKAGHTGLRHYLSLKGYLIGDTLLEKELHQLILPLL